MILALEDNGGQGSPFVRLKKNKGPRRGPRGMKAIRERRGGKRSRFLYNPETGIAKVIPVKPVNDGELSGPFKGLKKKIKAKKAFKEKKREIKQEQKLKRVENRQTAKTGRQEQRQLRKQTRLEVRTTKQENRRLKQLGKREITAAKQQSKLQKIVAKNQEAIPEDAEVTQEATYDEEADSIPETEVTGGDYMISPESNMDATEYEEDEETQDAEYEEVPEEEGGELSAGWIDAVVKVAKGAAGGIVNAVAPNSKVGNALLKIKDSKTGQTVQKLVNSKTGQAIKTVVTANNEVVVLRKKNAELEGQNKSLKNQRIYYAGGALVVGLGVGYMAGKKRK